MDSNLSEIKARQDQVFEEIAKIMTSLAAPVRLKLIHFLAQAPLTVEVLAQKINQPVANTSMHLRKMLMLQIVRVTSEGQKRIYSLHPSVLNFWDACKKFADQVNPLLSNHLNGEDESLEWDKNLEDTLKLVKHKEIFLIDVRPEDEIDEDFSILSHANGIIHSSEKKILSSIEKLGKTKPIVIFCRGKFCGLSIHLVNKLRKKGYKSYRLNESWHAINHLMKKAFLRRTS
jgi:DNA-binding transcriptional ArsR family regulator